MSTQILDCADFLNTGKGELIIDVRAPIEFFKGHIVGSVNMPLFDNTERAEIGTIFKQQGKELAVNRGLEIVSPKMVPFVKEVKELSKDNKVFIYCARGGMRSNSFAWLMSTSGLQAHVLKGGYKAYRNFVLDSFTAKRNIILIGGNTGSGKTDILKALKKDKISVVDLEAIAHHKGSAFGNINEQKQNPQQVFENQLYTEFGLIDQKSTLILEDESHTIGFNKIPLPLWRQMTTAPIIRVHLPFEHRLKNILKDYTTQNIHELKESVNKIAQQLGPNNTKLCIQLLDEGNLEEVAKLALNYYDKAYDYKYATKKERTTDVYLDSLDMDETIIKVKQAIHKISNVG